MKKTTWVWWLIFAALVAVGCAEATNDDDLVSSTLETDFADGRADAPATWRVKADAMTMWVDTTLTPSFSRGKTFWTMRGRVSKTLTGFRAYTSAGYHFQAKMVSERRFEILLSEQDVLDVVGGELIYMDFFAQQGATPMYHGMVNFAARFGDWAGTSSIYVYRAVNPVIVGEHVKFRGRASTRAGFTLDCRIHLTDTDLQLPT